jgi:hypothetical protein
LSADGDTVAIGAPYNIGSGTNKGGQVRVYRYSNESWVQHGNDIDHKGAGVSVSFIIFDTGMCVWTRV